jgi:hypothetical protein
MPFKLGNNLGRGDKNAGTVKLSKDEWENFGQWLVKGGVERLNQELSTLEGKEFVQGFTSVLEYFRPKLARQELTGKDGQEFKGVNVYLPSHERLEAPQKTGESPTE